MDDLISSNCRCSAAGLILYSAILSIIIGQNMTPDEMDLLGNLLQAVGQNLAILSTVLSSDNCLIKDKGEN